MTFFFLIQLKQTPRVCSIFNDAVKQQYFFRFSLCNYTPTRISHNFWKVSKLYLQKILLLFVKYDYVKYLYKLDFDKLYASLTLFPRDNTDNIIDSQKIQRGCKRRHER